MNFFVAVRQWALRGVIVLVPAIYVLACSFASHTGQAALGEIRKGDREEKVIELFGTPTTREKQGVGYPRYADDKCVDPCVERLWFENRLSLVDEAWVVALGKDKRVIEAGYLVSP